MRIRSRRMVSPFLICRGAPPPRHFLLCRGAPPPRHSLLCRGAPPPRPVPRGLRPLGVYRRLALSVPRRSTERLRATRRLGRSVAPRSYRACEGRAIRKVRDFRIRYNVAVPKDTGATRRASATALVALACGLALASIAFGSWIARARRDARLN